MWSFKYKVDEFILAVDLKSLMFNVKLDTEENFILMKISLYFEEHAGAPNYTQCIVASYLHLSSK